MDLQCPYPKLVALGQQAHLLALFHRAREHRAGDHYAKALLHKAAIYGESKGTLVTAALHWERGKRFAQRIPCLAINGETGRERCKLCNRTACWRDANQREYKYAYCTRP